MIFTTRDLDILRFLRWCRFVLAENLTGGFSKVEVQNLEILRLIKLYQPAQAYTLTAAGNRLLDAAFPKLPAAVAPAYKAADTIRRIRQSTAGGHKMAAFLLTHHQQMRMHNVAGRATVRQQISHCFKIWR